MLLTRVLYKVTVYATGRTGFLCTRCRGTCSTGYSWQSQTSTKHLGSDWVRLCIFTMVFPKGTPLYVYIWGQGGQGQPKLHHSVGNTGHNGKKKYIKSQTDGTSRTFFFNIAHAAFLDSGSFCKTRRGKEYIDSFMICLFLSFFFY